MSEQSFGARPWRDLLPVHPAAALFPPLSDDERAVLVTSVRANGLRMPVQLVRDDKGLSLLDGQNRLDALTEAGFRFVGAPGEIPSVYSPAGKPLQRWCETLDHPSEPFEIVVELNILRRHLTRAQARDLIARLLRDAPERSNRDIAALIHKDHKTVGAVRRGLEAANAIPRVERTVGHDGRVRTAAPQRKTDRAAPTASLPVVELREAPPLAADADREALANAAATPPAPLPELAGRQGPPAGGGSVEPPSLSEAAEDDDGSIFHSEEARALISRWDGLVKELRATQRGVEEWLDRADVKDSLQWHAQDTLGARTANKLDRIATCDIAEVSAAADYGSNARHTRWAFACNTLRELLDEWATWLDNLAEQFRDSSSPLAEKLQAMADFEEQISELESADLPIGWGRD
jgi:hypothetical protein